MKSIPLLFAAFALGLLVSPAGPVAAQGAAPDSVSTVVNPKIPRLTDVAGGGDPTLVDNLRKGGFVIFFRHAATDWSQRDQMLGMNFENRSLQRNLSVAGRADAASIGKAFKTLAIPIDSVFVSPMWRCRDTAQIAFGQYEKTMALFGKVPQYGSSPTTPAEERAEYRAMRVRMLSTAPGPAMNRVLVGQQDPMIPIIPGLHRDELREGDALVIEPLGDANFKVVAQVTLSDWVRLAAAYPGATKAGAAKSSSHKKSSK
jgi:hypothetical protein